MIHICLYGLLYSRNEISVCSSLLISQRAGQMLRMEDIAGSVALSKLLPG